MAANRFNFRLWCKRTNKFDYSGFVIYPKAENGIEYPEGGWDLTGFNDNENCDYILMQSTGLVDRNGKEIFEGCIIKYIYPDGECIIKQIYYSKEDGQMYYANKSKSFYACFCEILPEEVEIIGNIYENKELLED